MCANSWTGLTSIRGLRKTSSRGKERLRLSLRRVEILSRTDTITTDLERTLLGSRGLPVPRWLMRCSENRYFRFWRRLRMSRSSNGQTRWQETPWSAIKVFIASTTKTKGTPQRTVEICGIIWTSWSEKENWGSFCIILMVSRARQIQNSREMVLQDLHWTR